MNTDPNPPRSAIAHAARELRDLQDQAEQAREVLARLQSDIVESLSRLDTRPSAEVIEANEELVLALLRIQTGSAVTDTVRNAARPSPSSGQPSRPASADPGRARDELQEANAQLLLATLDAKDQRAVAESTQRRQTEYLAVLAHELRGPLAPIRTAVSLLGRLHTDEPELLARLRAVIERQVVHVSRMIADLLDVSRLRTGKLRLEPQLVEMTTIIDEVAEACRPAMEARQQQFHLQRPDAGLQVLGDPIRLTQILQNLLENASKYTQNGGEIKFCAIASEHVLVITVSDNGIGITADALVHIFEPFVQDAHAVDYSGTGIGIGLALARELVEAHGGTILASSGGIGEGSQFVAALPLA